MVETKVKAGTAAAAAAGLVLWVLGRYVFKGAVPAALTFAAGYYAKHTSRPAPAPAAPPPPPG